MNKSFYNFKATSLDILAEALAFTLAKTYRKSILQPTIILIPANEISKWLTQKILNNPESGKIFASIKYAFPANFFWEITKTLIDNVPKANPFSISQLRWQIWQILINQKNQPTKLLSDEINLWLSKNNEVEIFQFSQSVAKAFDNYRLYFEDVLIAWQKNKLLFNDSVEKWQAEIWQIINQKNIRENIHAANNLYEWINVLENPKDKRFTDYCQKLQNNFPNGIHCFTGIPFSQLPQQYHRAINALAKVLEVVEWQYQPVEDWTCGYPWENKLSLIYKNNIIDTNLPTSNIGEEATYYSKTLATPKFQVSFTDNINVLNYIKNLWSGNKNDYLDLKNKNYQGINIGKFSSLSEEISYWGDFIFDKIKTAKYSVNDINILTPKPQDYGGLIQAIWSSRQQPIPFYWQKNISPITLIYWQKVQKLMNDSFSAQNFLSLICSAVVCENLSINNETIKDLRYIINNSNWKVGSVDYARELQVYPDSPAIGFEAAIKRIKTFIAENENQIITKIINIAEELFAIYKNNLSQKTIIDWCVDITKIVTLTAPNLLSHWQELQQRLVMNNRPLGEFCEITIPQKLFINILNEVLFEEENKFSQSSYSDNVGGIKLLPFMSDHIIPAKINILMGMSVNNYQQTMPKSTFDLTNENFLANINHKITNPQDEKFLAILQTIQASEEYLGISYVEGSKTSPQIASYVLRDLSEHLRNLDFDLDKININPSPKKPDDNNINIKMENNYKYFWATENNQNILNEGTVELFKIQKQLTNPVKQTLQKHFNRSKMFIEEVIETLPNSGSDRFDFAKVINKWIKEYVSESSNKNINCCEHLQKFAEKLIISGDFPYNFVGDVYLEKLKYWINILKLIFEKLFVGENIDLSKLQIIEKNININNTQITSNIIGVENSSNDKYKNLNLEIVADLEPENLWQTWLKHIIINYNQEYHTLVVNLYDNSQIIFIPNEDKKFSQNLAEKIINLYYESQKKLKLFHPKLAKASAKYKEEWNVKIEKKNAHIPISQSNQDITLELIWQAGLELNEVIHDGENIINSLWIPLQDDLFRGTKL